MYIQNMVPCIYMEPIFKQLDEWVAVRNLELRAEGMPGHPACEIRVVGQTALLLANTGLHLAATKDVDVSANYDVAVKRQFERLLMDAELYLDPVGHEAWMPRETEFREIYRGTNVRALIAEPDYVLLSKALKAPEKNRNLLVEYLARGASPRFMALATKYKVALEDFV